MSLKFPGENGSVRYGEGLFIGYRGLDETEASSAVVRVGVTVTNTGDRAGAAVPQLYLGRPASAVARPPRELKGFLRMELVPGEQRRVDLA